MTEDFELNEQGAYLCYQGRQKEALPLLQKATKINPDNTDAWFSLGGCYFDLEYYQEALDAYIKILEIDRFDQQAQAAAVLTEGRGKLKAPPLLNSCLDPRECNRLGQIEYKQAENSYDLEKALFFFNKTLELDSLVAPVYNNRGQTLRYLKRFDEAIADFDNALALDPTMENARRNKKKCLQEKQELEIRSAKNIDHDFAPIYIVVLKNERIPLESEVGSAINFCVQNGNLEEPTNNARITGFNDPDMEINEIEGEFMINLGNELLKSFPDIKPYIKTSENEFLSDKLDINIVNIKSKAGHIRVIRIKKEE